MLGVVDCVWLAVPQPTEWQHLRNQIDAAMIFAEADFINVLELVIGQRLVESSG